MPEKQLQTLAKEIRAASLRLTRQLPTFLVKIFVVCERKHKTIEVHASSKNAIPQVLGSQGKGTENNCKKPQLLKLRDNDEQLCKDVDLLDSYMRNK